jgi:hypothetical protein
MTLCNSPEFQAKVVETAHQETGVMKNWAQILNMYTESTFAEACDTVYELRGQLLPRDSGALASMVQILPLGVM